jgi:drug/metabolite transporter (DMT)-like permease
MTTTALLLALTAALVHAVWNVLLARARDPQAATAVALLTAEVVFAVPAYLAWHMDSAVWPYIVASGALQLLYFALLVTAYRLLPLSVVYPVSRGVAPVLVLVIGIVALGHATSVGQVLGVCLVGAGILLVRGLKPTGRAGVVFGLVIACVIATYTLVDKRGITHAAALSYLEISMLAPALLYASYVGGTKGLRALRAEITPSTLVAGVATFGAYCLVLLALLRAAAAPVAAVRETSVVVTALLAGRFLAEPVGRTRLAGAVVVACGIALVSLT